MAWNSRISLVQVDETCTKFQFFKQLCPSWDLPLLFSVHEPSDFSCSCSGLERNPFGKKNTGIAFSTAADFAIRFGGKNSQPRLSDSGGGWFREIHPRMGFPIRDRSELSSQGPRNIGNPFAKSTKVYKNLLTNGDKRQSYKSTYLPRPTWDECTIS